VSSASLVHVTGGPSACRCCRRLSPRPGAGRGDQLPDLQAETIPRVAPLPARGGAPRGIAASLARSFRSAARAAAPGGRASATGVLEVRSRRTRLRTAVVRRVPEECPGDILLPRPYLLPLVREEEAAAVGRVAARGCAAARGAPPRGAHHPAPVAPAVSPPAGATRRARSCPRRPPERARCLRRGWCRSYCAGLSAAPELQAVETGPVPDMCRADRMEATTISAISSRQAP
jgi:hypothetical protein